MKEIRTERLTFKRLGGDNAYKIDGRMGSVLGYLTFIDNLDQWVYNPMSWMHEDEKGISLTIITEITKVLEELNT